MAPKDLEKYGAPTAHASYFFKKNKSLFTLTTTIKKNKQYFFQVVFIFLFLSLIKVKYFVVRSKFFLVVIISNLSKVAQHLP